jgi:hypothetical protein
MTVRVFPVEPARVVATVAHLLRLQGQIELAAILAKATARIEETGYDIWNGGTYFHTLHLDVPVALFAQIEPTVADVERAIAEKVQSVLRNTGSDVLNQVVIGPTLESAMPDAMEGASGPATDRLWGSSMFPLFISHVSAHKAAVSGLKRELSVFGVSGFVAHEDIEPSLDWQAEILQALRSMEALVALLTPEFHESKWTDQEIGVGVARGILIVPIRLGLDPYGFIAKDQGLRGDLAAPGALASAVVTILLRRSETATAMRQALVAALERASSFAISRSVTAMIESTRGFTNDQLLRFERSIETNGQVNGSHGVPERLRQFVTTQGTSAG